MCSGTKQHYLFPSWSPDAGPQHPFHIFIWDRFPFTVNQISFQIRAPFKHFLGVSTIFGSILDKIQYSLFNNNFSFTHHSIHTQGCSPSCNYFLLMFPVLLCLIYLLILLQHCFHSFKLCCLCDTFRNAFVSNFIFSIFCIIIWRFSTCFVGFLNIRFCIWFFTNYFRVQSKTCLLLHSGTLFILEFCTLWYSICSGTMYSIIVAIHNLLLHCYCFFLHSFSYSQLNKVITVLFFLLVHGI